MRKKFKIYYPKDHKDPNLAGKRYKPKEGCMFVMNEGGIFFFVEGFKDWNPYITPLKNVLPKYDVVWGKED